jgi:serine/threonine protein kinase
MIGNVVGPYKITEKIGEGGMGSVFKGIDTMLEREVAIKMLRPELARQPDVLERFRTEAITLAKLNHPNIATLYSFLRNNDDYFMIMEYVRGNTLETVLTNFGAIAYERAIPLFCQALEGINHAHKQGIVHRDLKPANVMVMDNNAVKVMDFGIARVLGTARMTRQGNVVGTVEYMSPEQIRGEDSDSRSDIYSLGILLYEMLTGRVPFNSTSEYEIMKLQIEEAPPPPTLFSAHLPLPIEQAIMRSLAKKAAARYQTAGEFRAALLGALSSNTNQLNNPTSNYSAPATRLDRDSDFITNPPKGTMVAGSVNQSAAMPLQPSAEPPARQAPQSGSTQKFASEAQTPAEPRAPVAMPPAAPANGFGSPQNGPHSSGAFQTQVQPSVSGSYPQATERIQNMASPQPAKAAPPSFFSKLNWKHYAGLGVLLIGLISVPAALTLRKGNAPPPAAVETQPAEEPTAETPAAADSQNPAAIDSQNANVADPSITNAQTQNGNAAVDPNKARNRRNEKTEETEPAGEEAKQTEPTPTPTTPDPKAAQNPEPVKEEKPVVAQTGDKKEPVKKEEKKKGGGIGGFFKKVFGGGDKKKEEKKP